MEVLLSCQLHAYDTLATWLVTADCDGKGRERAAAEDSIGKQRGLHSTDFTLESVRAVQNIVQFNVRLKCPPSAQSSCTPQPGEQASGGHAMASASA